MPGRLTYGDIDAISCRLLARRFLRRDRESIARYMVRIGSTDERKIRMWSDRSRLIDAPSITPGGLTRQNGGRSHGIRDGRALPIFRVLFQLLVHPWTVALANATIVLVLALGFLYMQRTGMEPLKTAEEVISGLGVILIGWGVALEERHKLREIFGLTGEREAREEAIDEACHRFGLGLLLFGLFAEIMVEAVRIPDDIINTSGIEKSVLAAAVALLGIGALLLLRQILVLARA